MASISEWLRGGDLDGNTVESYRRRANRPDGQAWANLHHVGQLTEIVEFVAWQQSNATTPKPDQPRSPNPVKQVPLTILQRAVSVATVGAATAARALATGHAFVTEDVILERLAMCRACDQFDQVKETCKLCGCGCSASAVFVNKLAHASSGCADLVNPKWGAVQ